MTAHHNTPHVAVPHPEVHPEWLGGGNPRAIEAQELEGQQLLAKSSMLPIEGSPGDKNIADEKRKRWEELGFRAGAAERGSHPVLAHFHRPPGYKLVPHKDHAMWSDLVDPDGKTVAEVFYKHSFYDRKAEIHLKLPWKSPSERQTMFFHDNTKLKQGIREAIDFARCGGSLYEFGNKIDRLDAMYGWNSVIARSIMHCISMCVKRQMFDEAEGILERYVSDRVLKWRWKIVMFFAALACVSAILGV